MTILRSLSFFSQRRDGESDQDDDDAKVLPVEHGRPDTCDDRGQHEKQDEDSENSPEVLHDIRDLHGAQNKADGKNGDGKECDRFHDSDPAAHEVSFDHHYVFTLFWLVGGRISRPLEASIGAGEHPGAVDPFR